MVYPVLLWFRQCLPAPSGPGLRAMLATPNHVPDPSPADTCVYTSGVLGSPHQRPEKETRPWADFCIPGVLQSPPGGGGKGEVRGSLLGLTFLKELIYVDPDLDLLYLKTFYVPWILPEPGPELWLPVLLEQD